MHYASVNMQDGLNLNYSELALYKRIISSLKSFSAQHLCSILRLSFTRSRRYMYWTW
jgi:hypothetical protein